MGHAGRGLNPIHPIVAKCAQRFLYMGGLVLGVNTLYQGFLQVVKELSTSVEKGLGVGASTLARALTRLT